MWPELLCRRVFTVGDRSYQWVDVVLHAMQNGAWSTFERTLVESVAAESYATEEDTWPDEAVVDRAGDEFRYERDLLAASDMTAWLEDTGLSLDDWFGYVQRHVVRRALQERLEAIVENHQPSLADLMRAAPADGLCSSALVRMAESLAGCIAVATGSPPAPDSTALPLPPAADPSRGRGLDWFPSWPADDLRARAGHIGEMRRRFDGLVRQALTPAALEARLREHHLEWLRLEVASMRTATEAAAREVQLLVREDGMSLAKAAAAGGTDVTASTCLLVDLAPDRRDVVLSARVGDVLGPFPAGGGWDLLAVVSKRPAALDDPDVRRRAEAAVVDALAAAASTAVRWHVGR
jgi:hypothetical protein